MPLVDSRICRLAEVLIHYSLGVQPGDLVAIHSTYGALPLLNEVYRQTLRAGGHPEFRLDLDDAHEIFLKEANDAQLQFVSPITRLVNERYDCLLYIDAESNTNRLSRSNPEREATFTRTYDELSTLWSQRASQGLMRWCYTQFPTEAYAQDAHMSLDEYCEFVFNAGMLNTPDPIASWQEMAIRQQRLISWLRGRKQVRITGRETDLTLSIEGRSFLGCNGHKNFPDGEIYSSPVEESAQGTITFNLPTTYNSRAVDGVRLRFEQGRVVEASATVGEAYLQSMLNLDEGARRLGEFSFGTNYGIKEATRNVLFDEKIGGTLHMALGRSYPESGGLNLSALHWDMVYDLRQQGEVLVDGELFLKDGNYTVLENQL
ncbi:MAG TPA: aminopeptidase [Ktedonobacteraceae bacterium]|nr:aminopeptidase [Ktedonobacteraceae bacterium]